MSDKSYIKTTILLLALTIGIPLLSCCTRAKAVSDNKISLYYSGYLDAIQGSPNMKYTDKYCDGYRDGKLDWRR